MVTESLRTLDRLRVRLGLPDRELAARRAIVLRLVGTLQLVDVDAAVLDRAAQPMPTRIGTLDAIHLATAILWQEYARTPLVFATHDAELALAAHAHGLAVVGTAV